MFNYCIFNRIIVSKIILFASSYMNLLDSHQSDQIRKFYGYEIVIYIWF